MTTKINGISAAAIGAGTLFVYAGVKGYSIPHAIAALIQGQPPSTGGQANPITTPAGSSPPASSPGATTGPVAPNLSHYSNSQMQGLWVMAGGSQAKAGVAACIGGKESGGDPKATSPNPDGGTNVGIWQLDTKGKGAGYTVAQLQDPLTNTRLAVSGSSDGTDWSAWSTASACGV